MDDRREHSLDLLAARATEGITGEEERDLRLLLQEFPDIDEDTFDLSAAAIDTAFCAPREEMPAELRKRIATEALAHVGRSRTVRLRPPGPVEARGFHLGWFMAAAAVLLAVLGWWPRLQRMRADTPTEIAGQVQSPMGARATLLATAADLLEREWTATEDPAADGASGDVVWSDSRNEGYMRIVGLETNDPGLFQYQLWVFDKERDDRYPVDGGVFDIPASGEVVVPIDPKILVDEAVLFAITVEAPGGVVVSGRERIVLLAQKG